MSMFKPDNAKLNIGSMFKSSAYDSFIDAYIVLHAMEDQPIDYDLKLLQKNYAVSQLVIVALENLGKLADTNGSIPQNEDVLSIYYGIMGLDDSTAAKDFKAADTLEKKAKLFSQTENLINPLIASTTSVYNEVMTLTNLTKAHYDCEKGLDSAYFGYDQELVASSLTKAMAFIKANPVIDAIEAKTADLNQQAIVRTAEQIAASNAAWAQQNQETRPKDIIEQPRDNGNLLDMQKKLATKLDRSISNALSGNFRGI